MQRPRGEERLERGEGHRGPYCFVGACPISEGEGESEKTGSLSSKLLIWFGQWVGTKLKPERMKGTEVHISQGLVGKVNNSAKTDKE